MSAATADDRFVLRSADIEGPLSYISNWNDENGRVAEGDEYMDVLSEGMSAIAENDALARLFRVV